MPPKVFCFFGLSRSHWMATRTWARTFTPGKASVHSASFASVRGQCFGPDPTQGTRNRGATSGTSGTGGAGDSRGSSAQDSEGVRDCGLGIVVKGLKDCGLWLGFTLGSLWVSLWEPMGLLWVPFGFTSGSFGGLPPFAPLIAWETLKPSASWRIRLPIENPDTKEDDAPALGSPPLAPLERPERKCAFSESSSRAAKAALKSSRFRRRFHVRERAMRHHEEGAPAPRLRCGPKGVRRGLLPTQGSTRGADIQ